MYIAEYSMLHVVNGVDGQIPSTPPIFEQTVAVLAGQTTSVAFKSATKFVRLHVDVPTLVQFATGAFVQATGASFRMAANATEYFGVNAGDGLGTLLTT
jgi:hypothetical protein